MRTRTATPADRHPSTVALDRVLAIGAVVLGVLGLVLAALSWPAGAIALGLAGMAIGLWAQMMSTTRGERFVDMAGLLASFVALAVGLSLL